MPHEERFGRPHEFAGTDLVSYYLNLAFCWLTRDVVGFDACTFALEIVTACIGHIEAFLRSASSETCNWSSSRLLKKPVLGEPATL